MPQSPLTYSLSPGKMLKDRTENNILGITGYRTFILSPKERPVIKILKVVGLTEQQSGRHITGDEREVRTIVAIENHLGTRCSNSRHKRIVVIGMTTEKPVGGAVDILLGHDVGIIVISKAYRRTEVDQHVIAGPVA